MFFQLILSSWNGSLCSYGSCDVTNALLGFRLGYDHTIRIKSFDTILFPYRGAAPELCNNCRRTGHFARDCPNAAVCNNCGASGYV